MKFVTDIKPFSGPLQMWRRESVSTFVHIFFGSSGTSWKLVLTNRFEYPLSMQKAIVIFFAGLLLASAQEQSANFDDLARSAQQWATENLDEDALRMLQSVDQEK